MSADILEDARILPHVVVLEWKRATAFRAGFFLQQVLRGVGRPVVMAFVFLAMFRAAGTDVLGGYTFRQIVAYLAWTASIQRLLIDERTLDLGEQIFDGYITKYLVLPVSPFTLIVGRFVQLTLLQLGFAVLFWLAGAALLPGWWPLPASGTALLEAGVLVLLGAWCYLLTYFILNVLAFWLEVVWSVLNMFRFIEIFVAGALLPVDLMPPSAQHVLRLAFPYWTGFASANLLLGRMGPADFRQGLVVLSISLVALQALAHVVWKRGLARHSGVGA